MKHKSLLFWKAARAALVVLLFAVAGLTQLNAQTFTVGDLNYSLNADGASVTVTGHVNGTDAIGELVIPASVEYYGASYAVTVIGERAFYGCTGLTGPLTIPESVTSIETYAFYGCSGLTGSLTIHDAVTSIGESAFWRCGFSGTLSLSENLTHIGYLAFSACQFSGVLTIPESVRSIGARAFTGSTFTTLCFNATDCSVLYNYWYIEEYGGWGQYDCAFAGLTSVTTLNIGENVQRIPRYAFSGLTGLNGTLVIPSSVTYIDEYAFSNCNGFTGLDFNAINCTTLNSTWLEGDTLLTLNIGESVQRIPNDFVNGKSSITGELTIPNSVTYIGTNAFSGCSGFSGALTLGTSLSEIGNNAFFGACEGFITFNVKAMVPPVLGTNVFASADYGLPVQVPCGTLEAYQNAEGWNVFANIQEPNPCLWDIAATANPVSGGTVTGAGTYEQGQTCTLTATPNEGIVFVNWTEDGVEVSTEAEYAFTVTGNRSLVANFEIPSYTINVTVNPSNGGSVVYDGNGELRPWDFEKGSIPARMDNSVSSYPWTVWSSVSYGGSYCMASNNTDVHNSESAIEATVEFAEDGTVAFWWRVSSENDYDKGRFYIDGNQQFDVSGSYGWIKATYEVTAGSHTFRWSYTKDVSYNGNEDRFFIDDIVFTGAVGNEYQVGQTCTLTATPSSDDFFFLNWTENGAVVSSDAQYSFIVTNDKDLVANFKQTRFEITALAVPESFGSVTGGGNFTEGQTCTLIATPNEGYSFYQWLENGEAVSTNATYSFVVDTDRTLTARFKASNTIIFADPNVETLCVNNWDTDTDGFLSYEEAAAVTDIGEVFRGNTEITSFNELQYFTNVTYMGYYAFAGCTNLTSVMIPEGVTTLDYQAFAYSGITEITIPESVTYTNNVVFEGCEALTVMHYNAINCTRVAEHYYSWLSGCNSLTTLTIGEHVQSIPFGAFRGCSNLTGELTIPESVTSIASEAFANTSFTTINYNATNCNYQNANYHYGIFSDCNSPATLHIGEHVQTIPDYLFSGHSGLVGALVIPNSVTSIGEEAFAGCSGLTGSLDIPSTVVSIGGGAFSGCTGFTGELVIPSSITVIEWSAFNGCSGFSGSLVIPNTVTFVGNYAFYGCTGLDGTLTISTSVQEVGSNAFSNTGFTILNYNAVNCQFGYYYNGGDWFEYYPAISNCQSLTTLNIGDSVESISIMAFKDLDNFTGTLTLPNSLKSIGDQAFYNCYGFEGIVLGNGIETIGTEAFRNCGGLRGELALPESLLSVGAYAFAGCDEISTVNYNAVNCTVMGNAQQSVFFDCASIEHLNIGANVESIPNYAFKRCSTIADMNVAATTPPTIQASTFATISRSIPVLVPTGSGDAYRNAPYWEEFFNIMEDGEQYSYYWDVDVHQYAHNLSVIGVVQINGEEQSSPALEIGAFCGDECRGRQLLTVYPDLNRSLVFLTVLGEEGDLITFRLYDHEAEEESTLACATVLTFQTDAIVGSYNAPEVLNFVEMQNAAIETGWTWYSLYVEGDGASLLQMMEESLGENGVMIKSHTDGFVSYDENGWMGNLTLVNPESMYMVNTSAPAVVSVTGPFADAAQHPITINPGWSWIGYPVTRARSLNNVLNGFTAQDGDIIKMQDAFSQYIVGIGWTGALKTLVPGEGLMYYSLNGATTTLTYTTGAKSDVLEKNITSEGNFWEARTKAYPYNMSVIAVVDLDGVEARDGRYELGAFDGDECRGSARLMYVEALDRYLAFVSVSGNGAADLCWLLFDHETKEVCRADEGLHFTPNAILGAAKEPLRIRFSGLTGTDELVQQVSCYPNPVRRNAYVRVSLPAARSSEARIEIMNAQGALVSSARVDALSPEVKAPATAGVYVVRVTIDGKGVVYAKLIVE